MQHSSTRKIATYYLLGATWFAVMLMLAMVLMLTLGGAYDALGIGPLLRAMSTMGLAAAVATTVTAAIWWRLQAGSLMSRRESRPTVAVQTDNDSDVILAPTR